MNNFYNEFERGIKLEIGQTFMVCASDIWKWEKSNVSTLVGKDEQYEYCEYGYDKIDNDHSDIYFIVKYIGDGYVQEMTTGETMLLTRLENNDILADNSEKLITADSSGIFTPSQFEVYKKVGYSVPIPDYVYYLELYKKLTTKSTLICNVDEGESMFKIDDISKEIYLKHSNEERIALMKKMKEVAVKSLEETIKDLDKTIQLYSSISPETIDMAYLENDIYNFENQGKKR